MCLFDIIGLKEELEKLEKESYSEKFWDDIQNAQKIMQKIKGYKSQIEEYENLKSSVEDLEVLIELAIEEEDYGVYKEIKAYYDKISKEAQKF